MKSFIRYFISVTFVIQILSTTGSYSQSVFNKHYDNNLLLDGVNAIIQTNDYGYLISGNSYNFSTGYTATLIIKTDCTGDTIWKKVYDLSNTGTESAMSLLELNNGGYIVSGYYQDTNLLKKDMYLMELDVKGNIIWFKAYGGTENEGSYMLKQTYDKGFILCGYTSSSMSYGGNDIYVVKTDSLGNVDWENNYGGVSDESGYSIDLTYDGGYIIGGKTYSYGLGVDDLYMVKIDSQGNFKWQKTYGTSGDDYGEMIIQTLDSGFVFVGGIDNGSGGYNSYIVKTDSSGNYEWDKIYTHISSNNFKIVRQLSDASYIVSGGKRNIANNLDGWLVRLDLNGDSLWSKLYGNPAFSVHDYFYDMCLTYDGGYAMGGQWNRVGPPYQNAWLVKTDSMGCDQPICNNGCDSCAYIHPQIYFPYDTIYLSSPTVQFTDTSDFAQTWFWDFGDTYTDTVQHPIHTFATAGIYDIMLIAYYNDCSDTIYKQVIVVNDVGISEINHKKIYARIYPNPNSGSMSLEYKFKKESTGKLYIYDVTGEEILRYNLENDKGIINIKDKNINPGVYLFKVISNDKIIKTDKLIIL
ncbi:MAG: T9SS type A sorting domain-containing protein [Bacteroidota bacterium]